MVLACTHSSEEKTCSLGDTSHRGKSKFTNPAGKVHAGTETDIPLWGMGSAIPPPKPQFPLLGGTGTLDILRYRLDMHSAFSELGYPSLDMPLP